MNETSRGAASRGGDPPIGGYPPAPSSTTPSHSAEAGGGATVRSAAGGGTAAGSTRASSTTTPTSNNTNSNLELPPGMSGDTDLDGLGEGLSLTRLLAGDTSNWDFSDPLGASVPTSTHNNHPGHQHPLGSYRPWEAALSLPSSTTKTSSHETSPSTFTTLTSVSTMAPPPNVLAPPSSIPTRPSPQFYQPHHYLDQRSLPSFQSQFQEIPPPYGTASAVAAASASGAVATHTPHAAVPHPHYPLVPPPVQAREIPNIQQQFLDERHIQSQHQLLTTYAGHAPPHIAQPRPHFPPTSRLAAHITGSNTASSVGSSPIVARKSQVVGATGGSAHQHERATPSSEGVTHLSAVEAHPTLAAQLRKKTARAGSLEGSESDHSSVDTPGQVAAISSTDPTPETLAGLADAFKPPNVHHGGGLQHPTPSSHMAGDDPDKPTKKKRKRCGECGGCQKKDNCGECAPCRNDKSHQICKLRRCDRLTEKKPRKPNPRGAGTGTTTKGRGKGTGRQSKKNATATATAAAAASASSTPNSTEFNRSSGTTTKIDSRRGTTGNGNSGSSSNSNNPGQTTQVSPMMSSWTSNTSSTSVSPWGEPQAAAQQQQQWATQQYPMAPPVSQHQFNQFNFGSNTPYDSFRNQRSLPSPNTMNSQFLGLNGNPAAGSPLGYNLAVNTAMHAAAAVSRPIQPSPSSRGIPTGATSLTSGQAGNCQPGYPVRPSEANTITSNLPNSNNFRVGGVNAEVKSEGHPGQIQRTDYSPDTTTKDLPNYLSQEQPSFLAYKAGDAPVTGQVKPKEKNRRENSNFFQVVPTNTTTTTSLKLLPLARTASAAPIKQEAVRINVLPLNYNQETNKLKQDTKIFRENDFTKKSQSSNSLLKHLGGKPIYGTVNLKKEKILKIKTEKIIENDNQQQQNLHPQVVDNEKFTKIEPSDYVFDHELIQPHGHPQMKTEIKSEIKTELQSQTFVHPSMVKKEEPYSEIPIISYEPSCNCFINNSENEPDVGPYYTHLGAARSLVQLRQIMEKRCFQGSYFQGDPRRALRIEKARYCSKEGKTSLGCPMAKYIVRRMSSEEKFLVIAKHRQGHHCDYQWTVISIVAWEGISNTMADSAYNQLANDIGKHGKAFARQCESNTKKTCACQGLDNTYAGASFTFGCSWSMYVDGCKYGKGGMGHVKKYRLSNKENSCETSKEDLEKKEKSLESTFDVMADEVGSLFKNVVPHAFDNMTCRGGQAGACRIGDAEKLGDERPFSGVTAVSDFCAHAHRDVNNVAGGITAVVTLCRPENRIIGEKPEDEQLHVLPNYAPDFTDEFDSYDGQNYKAIAGEVEFLEKFERKLVKRSVPKKSSCKRGHPTPQRKKFLDNFYKISKNNSSDLHPMNIKEAVEEATIAMNSPSKKSAVKRSKKMNKSESNQQEQQQPLGNMGNMPFVQRKQYQQLPQMPVLIPNQNAQNLPQQQRYHQAQPAHNIHHQNMGKPLGINVNTQPALHKFNNQSQPTSISIQANHVTVFQNMGNQPLGNFGLPSGNIIPTIPPQTTLFPQNYQHNYMGKSMGMNMPLSPPNSVQEDDLNLLLQEGLNTNPGKLFPNVYYGNIGGQLDGHVSPIPQLDGITEDKQMSWPNTDFSLQYPLTPQSSIASSPVASPVIPIEETKIQTSENEHFDVTISDCKENFGEENIDIGGLALALPHGSVLFECAKTELHATTALKQPNRFRPTRIGLVFYQHKQLNYPNHGYHRVIQKSKEKNARDYEAWKSGTFIPTPRKLQSMKEDGFVFPKNIETVAPGAEMMLANSLTNEQYRPQPHQQLP